MVKLKLPGPIGVLAALTLLASESAAQSRQVCLDDQAGLTAPAEGAFYREFQSLAGPRGVQLIEEGCEPDSIRLTIYQQAAGRKGDALGGARVEGSAIAPRLEVYVDRVIALLPETQCWTVIGRAMARVAAHEVAHYLDQRAEHEERGLLRERFSATDLAGEDSYPFRWTPRPSQRQTELGEAASLNHD